MASPHQPHPEIRLDALEKRYGDVVAVDGVSLDIVAGEFFSLLGPSGCGKTTTLRMIGGFEYPTAGRVLLRGRDVTADPPDKRAVNMVFQQYALFPHLSVGDNVAFGPTRRKLPKDEIRRRVAESLALVHLEGYERRKPHQLSGGQQQRVALARALANEPNVLLLDEPLGALDLKLRRQLQVELKRIQAEVGITFVYVTHDQEEALTMSDRIAVMHNGRVEQLGTPEDLYDRPATRFVADFVGTTNLLAGVVERGCVRLTSGELVRATLAGRVDGEPVEVSLRPESLRIREAPEAGPAGEGATAAATDGLAGCVEQAAYLGSSISYLVRTDGGIALSVLAPKDGVRLPVGRDVIVTWSPGTALVLGSAPAPAQEEVQP